MLVSGLSLTEAEWFCQKGYPELKCYKAPNKVYKQKCGEVVDNPRK